MFYLIESKAYLNGNVTNSELDVDGLKVRYDYNNSLTPCSYEFDDIYASNILLWDKLFSDKSLNSVTVKIESLDDDNTTFIFLDHNGNYQYDENGAVKIFFQVHENNHEVKIKLLHSCHPSTLKLTCYNNCKKTQVSNHDDNNTKSKAVILFDKHILRVKKSISRLIVLTIFLLAFFIFIRLISANVLIEYILVLAMFVVEILIILCTVNIGVMFLIKILKQIRME